MQSTVCNAEDRIILVDQLPAPAKSFISSQFPDAQIAYAQIDRDGRTTYDVRLMDGTELDFDKRGNWDKVDCQFNAVPANLIPENISTFVNVNFPGTSIVKIDKERRGFKIELSNDLELKFNKKGMLIKIDD